METLSDSCQPLYCRSVGWLVSEANGCKTIVPHLSGDKNGAVLSQGQGDLTIPDQAIIKFRALKL